MRLFCLFLLSFAGLCLGAAHAGALVGDWWQEDSQEASSNEKRAISQPVSRSTEDIQVTLGIKGTGSAVPVDFFLVISSKATIDSCLYTVDEIIIDSQSFPVSGPGHRSDIDGIRAATAEAQKRLWQAFIKGRGLSLKIGRTCSGPEQTANATNTFDFLAQRQQCGLPVCRRAKTT